MYRFNPIPKGITKEQEKFIIGTQVCIWCEVLEPSDMLAWVFPRVLAAAEVGWLPLEKRQSYDNFCKRVYDLEARFSFINVPIGHPVVGGNRGDKHLRYLN
ncbi:MAG: family 20 glycosylhydrolase [Candidatus Sumerlaeales bacterium]|nr:family 20 glycosylhydrolase [Candidatus Sumerlaeales bacterium]